MKLKTLVILGISLLILANMSLAAKDAKPPVKEVTQDIEIILDASGSMMARIGKQTKIDIAKKVLIDLVESLKDRSDLSLAVRVYGHQFHRDEKNCKDTKLEIPFGKPDLKKVKTLMGSIKAQGWTPIAYSLLETKKDFDLKADRKRTIILITDGLESCGGNPCKVAEELAKAGITIHVIAFDLAEKEIAQLKCIVKPSNGLLLTARDADQLKKSLSQAIKTSIGGKIKITAFRNKEPIRALARAYRPGDKDEITADGIQPDKPGELILLPGTYDIKVIDLDLESEPTITLSGIKIESGKTIERTVDFAGGVLIISIVKNGEASEGRVNVFKSDGEEVIAKWIEADEPEKLELIPGIYNIVVEDTTTDMRKYPTQTLKEIEIAPGETLNKVVKFSGGFLKLKIIKDGDQIQGTAYVYSAGTSDELSWKDTDEEEWTIFKLSVGTYDVKVEDAEGAQKLLKGIKIKAGETQTLQAEF